MQTLRVAQNIVLILNQPAHGGETPGPREMDIEIRCSSIGETELNDFSERLRALITLQMPQGSIAHSRVCSPRILEDDNA